MALEAPDAIKKWRTLMGATDPAKAEAGTLRKELGQSIEKNATHGSDAPETATFELGYFFPGLELAGGMGKLLGGGGLITAGIGMLVMLGVPVGRLPGDITVRRGNFTFYFPLVTSIIASILLTLLLALLRR